MPTQFWRRRRKYIIARCVKYTDKEICEICSDDGRDKSLICVVEDAKDVAAFERTKEYKGLYHVLGGLISPMDGIGPDQLFVKELLARVQEGTVHEIIMATNPTPLRARRPLCI